MTGKRFLVVGYVQGVGFRWSTQKVARQLGLNGWCRNLVDGSVEVCAYGDETDINQLFSWLHKGPQGAGVSRVESFILDDVAPTGFEIRR